MKQKTVIILKLWFIGLCICIWFSGNLTAAIPPEERAALIAFYNATNGDQWKNNSGWKEEPLHFDDFSVIGSEEKWYGVTISNDHVTKLEFFSNKLEGSLPEEIEDLKNLEELVLFEKGVGNTLPGQIGFLVNMRKLRLYCNFSGSLPRELGDLVNLESLHLTGGFDGGLPLQLGNLTILKDLMLNGRFTGEIPPALGDMENLQSLELFGHFSGSIPPQLNKLINLKKLVLSFRLDIFQFKQAISTDQDESEKDQYYLTGSIPPELGKLTQLEDLTLRGHISGEIPSELGNLKNLKRLKLNDNKLIGLIPHELGDLTKLENLNLSDNMLSGPIPAELGNLSQLKHLWLNHNRLTGSIPAELGNLNSLQQLKLEGNRLNGEIPINISSLSAYLVNLNYNSLYSLDPMLRSYLQQKDQGWFRTQTVAPVGVKVITNSDTTATISWEPIAYTRDSGGYHIYMNESISDPWILIGTVSIKSNNSFEVTALHPSRDYYFVVQSFTNAHSSNPNDLNSQYSKETEVTTPTN
jgi:Leucine-rich repeat (LRR) protein